MRTSCGSKPAHCALEVAEIFRVHGPAWRVDQRGHLSLSQLKVMSAIEQRRTADHERQHPACGESTGQPSKAGTTCHCALDSLASIKALSCHRRHDARNRTQASTSKSMYVEMGQVPPNAHRHRGRSLEST